MQVEVGKTLDVEVVERQLAELWAETAGERERDDAAAVLRARVANLLVFVENDSDRDEVRGLMTELTARHPSRVLLMLGKEEEEDRDIEMSVETFCQSEKSGAKRLCCEEIVLKAQGKYVVELPSAALPLLVSDLSTFLWWRPAPQVNSKVLVTLAQASDRLVIDSASFDEPQPALLEMNEVYNRDQFNHVGISDLNWARLTLWRGLLADFYDVPAYQESLNEVSQVRIEYTGPEFAPESCAPQALFIAGWLASRLEWSLSRKQQTNANAKDISIDATNKEGRSISIELNRVERGEHMPGRLVQVELHSSAEASFVVSRSADNLHIISEARIGNEVQRGRVLPVRNRSDAQLLSREMEILCNDQIYQEAVAIVTKMIEARPS